MIKKEMAISFIQMAGSGKVQSAYDKYIAESFIHHNQYFKGDRKSLLVGMTEAHAESPNKSIEVRYAYEDGNTVVTHSLVEKKDMKIIVVHIFRFEGEKIVELWDVGQIVDSNSPNENGLF